MFLSFKRLLSERRAMTMDRKIVEESYLVFSPSLYLYALSLTKDERKAEQLVSEAYYKLLCQTHAPDQLKFLVVTCS